VSVGSATAGWVSGTARQECVGRLLEVWELARVWGGHSASL